MDFDNPTSQDRLIFTGVQYEHPLKPTDPIQAQYDQEDNTAPTIQELEDQAIEEHNKAMLEGADDIPNGITPLSSVLFVVGPLFLFASLALTAFFSHNNQINSPEILQVSNLSSEQVDNYAYEIDRHPDQTYDVFYKGTLTQVTADQPEIQNITLTILDNNQKPIAISLPLPTTLYTHTQAGSVINFQELFSKGVRSINIRIRYDKDHRLLDWELIQ